MKRKKPEDRDEINRHYVKPDETFGGGCDTTTACITNRERNVVEFMA